MARTLLQMRTAVRTWLHETVSNESFYTDTLINNMINASYRRRCTQIMMAYEGCFVKIATQNIVAGQESYAWPSGFERLLKLEYVDTSGVKTPLQRWERHETSIDPKGISQFTFRPTGGGFILEPTPQQAIGSLRLEYLAVPASLGSDSDSPDPDFPTIYDELIVLDAAVNCLDSESLLENGVVRSVLRARTEVQEDFTRWIENRMVTKQNVEPFLGPYLDA